MEIHESSRHAALFVVQRKGIILRGLVLVDSRCLEVEGEGFVTARRRDSVLEDAGHLSVLHGFRGNPQERKCESLPRSAHST